MLVLALVTAAASFAADLHARPVRPVRPYSAAGSFYPADAAELRHTVDSALHRVPTPGTAARGTAAPETAARRPAAPLALIVPHAGYAYSGDVAATAFALLRGHRFKRVIVIGPSHFEDFDYTSVYAGDAYSTPLGRVRVDRAFAQRLAHLEPSIRVGTAGHLASRGADAEHGISQHGVSEHGIYEHSVEVELPFLQRTLGDFELVPIVMGDDSYDNSRKLGEALAKLLAHTSDTLLVASSDLSHFHDARTAAFMDRGLLDAIRQSDYRGVSRQVQAGAWEACGDGPIVAVMIAALRLGAAPPQFLKYANSADAGGGDDKRVVGYGAVAFMRQRPAESDSAFALSDAERNELLQIARSTVQAMVREHRTFQPEPPVSALPPAPSTNPTGFPSSHPPAQRWDCVALIVSGTSPPRRRRPVPVSRPAGP